MQRLIMYRLLSKVYTMLHTLSVDMHTFLHTPYRGRKRGSGLPGIESVFACADILGGVG